MAMARALATARARARAIALTSQCVQLDKRDQRKGRSYKNERAMLFAKQKTCHWCGCELTLETSTLEHIYPLSKGGLDQPNNWTLACHACNQKRGNSMPELNQS
jgi:5-methylcytosine-specific restriction endonuclease McrA